MANKRATRVKPTELPCSCGGVLRASKQESEFDASAELGIPAKVEAAPVVMRCELCDGFALPGNILEALSDEAVLRVLALDRRVSGGEARFLRKAALGLGQEELARGLGITRVTVARWEAEKSLSAEHDFELRALVLARLLSNGRNGAGRWKTRRAELVELVTQTLGSVRTNEAPARPPPLRLML